MNLNPRRPFRDELKRQLNGEATIQEPWNKYVLRTLKEDQDAQREYDARKAAEAEAEENPPPQTAADILRCALAGTTSPKHLPLNGAGVVRAAMAAMKGPGTTVTGE
jgi:hypothetical protein